MPNTWCNLEPNDVALVMFSGGLESSVAAEKVMRETDATLILAHILGPHYWADAQYQGAQKIKEYLNTIAPVNMLVFENTWPLNPGLSFLYHFIAAQICRTPRLGITTWIKTEYWVDERAVMRKKYCEQIFKSALWSDINGYNDNFILRQPFGGKDKQYVISQASAFVRENLWTCVKPIKGEQCGTCDHCQDYASNLDAWRWQQ